MTGTVRSLTDYGAFVDIGGVDAPAARGRHFLEPRRTTRPTCSRSGSRSKSRSSRSIPKSRRISLSMKQLQPNPWDSAAESTRLGERVHGTVTRVAEFGAFVELEPGIEGLIHLSEMSWAKKAQKPADVVKPGETVEVVILE